MTEVFDHSCDCDPPSDAIPEFDARQVPSLVRPASVFGAVGGLPAGMPLILVTPHEPAGLLAALQRSYPDLGIEFVSDAPGEYKVQLLRG